MIAAVVLASGFSRRMGRSKLDLEIGGRTFLQRAIDAASGTRGIGRCLVVVRPEDASRVSGYEPRTGSPTPYADAERETGDSQPRIEVVSNPFAEEGQSASIRLAIGPMALDPGCDAAIFAVVDQPFLTSDVFERLIASWRASVGEILVSTYNGQRGNPVLFARRFFDELEQLSGDVGGREVILSHPEAVREVAMPDPAAGQDVDTWEDYERARGSATR